MNPIVLFVALAVIGALWGLRALSSRCTLGVAFSAVLAWVVHLDYLMFVVGSDTLPPLDGWAPWPVRLLVYVVACAFLLWGAWGWLKVKSGKEMFEMTRGLPYLRERWRERKQR